MQTNATKSLTELQREAWQIAEDKGFHADLAAHRFGTLVRLDSVLTELGGASRHIKRYGVTDLDKFAAELANISIQVLELAHGIAIPIHLQHDLPAWCVTGMDDLLGWDRYSVLIRLGRVKVIISRAFFLVDEAGLVIDQPEMIDLNSYLQTSINAIFRLADGLNIDLLHAIQLKNERDQGRSYP